MVRSESVVTARCGACQRLNSASAPPRWVSTDELGDLAAGTWRLYQSLQQLPVTLHASAEHLARAGGRLSGSR